MNQINPRKLQLSKWTARSPRNREKHFMVTRLIFDQDDEVLEVELEAVISGRAERMEWQRLLDSDQWLMGWK